MSSGQRETAVEVEVEVGKTSVHFDWHFALIKLNDFFLL